jgi:CheY-like chemotaxis protein
MSLPLIVHVEDHLRYRRLVGKFLDAQGYSVIEAEDGLTGLECIRRLRPSLVLMEIGLPGLDGLSVMQRVKTDATLCHIPVIALTALRWSGERDRLLAAGFDGYLAKPVPLALLLKCLQVYLR